MSSWDEVRARLTELSSSTATFQRLAAANALGAYTVEPEARSLLRRLSKDEDATVRESSLEMLGEVARNSTSLVSPRPDLTSNTAIGLMLGGTSKAQRSEATLELLGVTGTGPNVEFPVPQANSLDVICTLIAESQTESRSIRDCVALSDLSHRQWAYYENAVGFVNLRDFRFSSPESIIKDRQISLSDFVAFSRVLLESHEVLRRNIQARLLAAEAPLHGSQEQMLRIWVSQLGRPAFSRDTLARRAGSLNAWVSWVSLRLDQLENFDDGSKTTMPEPTNVTPMIWGFLGALEDGQPNRPKRGRERNSLRGQAPSRTICTASDFARVKRRMTRVRQTGGISLEEEGAAFGITRQRVRQIEKKVSTLLEIVVEKDGVEAIRAVKDVLKKQIPVSLGDWVLGSLRHTFREEHSQLPPHLATTQSHPEPSSLDTDNRELRETLVGHFGPEPVERLPGSNYGAVGLAVMVLRGSLLHQGMHSGRATNHLWVEPGTLKATEAQPSMWEESEQTRNRSQRIAKILEELTNGPMSAADLARKIDESSPRALAEFMRRQPTLAVERGLWSIKNANYVGANFSTAYDALIHVLETHGPANARELSERLENLHPMSISRLQQAMDDRRVGRMDDGRVGLLAQGATRKEEKQPKVPARLIIQKDVAGLILTANNDHLRGSGFQVPRWLGWRLGLKATPDSVSLRSSHEQIWTLTRRGGQIFGSSIRSFLVEKDIELGCACELSMNLASRTFEVTHLCQVH